MKDHVTPEEKLLRLIRREKKESTAGDQARPPQSAVARAGAPFFFLWLKKITIIVLVRKALVVLFIGSCLFLAYAYVHPLISSNEIVLSESPQSARIVRPLELAAQEKSLDFYVQGTKDRPLFGCVSAPLAEVVASDSHLDLMKDLGLVGIFSGEKSQAVIENKKDKKTFYVSKGEWIGEFQVFDIQEGQVVLDYHGQKFKLFL